MNLPNEFTEEESEPAERTLKKVLRKEFVSPMSRSESEQMEPGTGRRVLTVHLFPPVAAPEETGPIHSSMHGNLLGQVAGQADEEELDVTVHTTLIGHSPAEPQDSAAARPEEPAPTPHLGSL